MSDDLKERLRSCAEEYRSEQINICLEAAGRIDQLENEVHVLSGAAQRDISAHNKLVDRNKQLERDLAEARKGHARYEYVRKLNVPQFTELYRTHITGLDRFDDLVDAAIAKDKQ